MAICNEIEIGQEGISESGERFLIIDRMPNSVKIKFLDEFGGEITRRVGLVKRGDVRNPYRITLEGVGRIGICNYTPEERSMWKRLCHKYAKGQLPHFNKRWLVLEYFIEDIKTLIDYDLLCREGIIAYDPFGRYDRLEHLIISHIKTHARGVVRYDLFSKEYDVYTCREECAWETGYSANTIFHYCHNQSERDGFKFYYADEFVTDHPEFF